MVWANGDCDSFLLLGVTISYSVSTTSTASASLMTSLGSSGRMANTPPPARPLDLEYLLEYHTLTHTHTHTHTHNSCVSTAPIPYLHCSVLPLIPTNPLLSVWPLSLLPCPALPCPAQAPPSPAPWRPPIRASRSATTLS